MLGCLGVGRDVRPRGPFRPARLAPPASGRALHGRLPGVRPDLARAARPSPLRTSSTSAGCGSSRASRTPERLRDLQRRMPWAKFVTSFGATECSSNLTLGGADDDEQTRTDTLGTLVPGMELKIVDPETGEERAHGVIGELCLRGYALFEGYYKDPEQTALAIDVEGWFHTGDLGSLRRARPPRLLGPAEGHAQGRRRERRRDRDRGLPRPPPRSQHRAGRRRRRTRATQRCRRRSSSSRRGKN